MDIYNVSPRFKLMILLFVDGIIFISSALLAQFLIGEILISSLALLVVIVFRFSAFFGQKLYKNIWRYTSLNILLGIIKSILLSQIIIFITILFFSDLLQALRFIIVDTTLLFLFVCASRISLRVLREIQLNRYRKNRVDKKSIFIIGAGDAGETIAREIMKSIKSPYDLKGFIDDDRKKRKAKINGISILGNTRQIASITIQYNIEEAIIAMPSASGKQIQRIIRECEKANITYKITPGIIELISGYRSISQIRDVKIEDLLGREVVDTTSKTVDSLQGKVVLVTGAGGSIGSEITRQVFFQNPIQLIILDHSEFACYEISRELDQLKNKNHHINTEVVTIVGDVKDTNLLNRLFNNYNIQTCYHAAAYKHVPLMEENVAEAIRNNIQGTLNLINYAKSEQIESFVLISTDKAVNPTNIMGATKRVCEVMLQIVNKNSKTIFSAVRFGNVLGSNGSVVPLFTQQIKDGGPITVTHPEITRYFMTIPEAVRLVLEAGNCAKGGEIFILDMGKPIKIVDLAEAMIQLSGLTVNDDIAIEFSGLRKGEKIHEELSLSTETLLPTQNKKIFITHPIPLSDNFLRISEDLIKLTHEIRPKELSEKLFQLVDQISR